MRQTTSSHPTTLYYNRGNITSLVQVLPRCHSWMLTKIGAPITFLHVQLTPEAPRARTLSCTDNPTSRVSCCSFLAKFCQTQSFRHRVRARDRVCMISGHDLSFANFIGQNVCHIIPRSHSEFVSPSVLLLMIF